MELEHKLKLKIKPDSGIQSTIKIVAICSAIIVTSICFTLIFIS